ncbi:AsmA family protein, partial [bacterium]|nr:AsmA family protein [bacterium]
MSDDKREKQTPQAQSQPEKRKGGRRFLKWFLGILAILALLLVVVGVAAYFYVSSRGFFDRWVQPNVEQALGCELRVDEYNLSPLSHVRLGGVTVQPVAGEEETPLRLANLNVRYDALAFLGGTIRVKEMSLDGLTVRMYRDAEGAIHGPFPTMRPGEAMPAAPKGPAPRATPAPSEEKTPREIRIELPFELDIRDVQVRDVNVFFEDRMGGEGKVYRAENLAVSIPDLSLERDSKVDVSVH